MKSIKALLLICLLGVSTQVNAQFLKRLKNRAEEAAKETISRKIENKTAEKTGEVMDTILNTDKKEKKREIKSGTNKNKGPNDINYKTNHTNKRTLNTKKDFVAGTKAIFLDTFKNDFVGDFPITWNTNSSGEIVTFNDSDSRWLQLGIGAYTPDGITQIPKNCTFEFDLTVTDNFDWYSDGITLNIIAVKDRRKDFMKWTRFSTGANGIRLRIKPKNFEYTGETAIQTYLDSEKIIDNTKNTTMFNLKNNNVVHVALWRQKTRLRIYLNDQKIWDIPRAFGNVDYNSITFNTSGKEEEHFFVSNLRLAVAGKDMRHALLETGKFVTNDILFDINKAIIKPSSFKILDELGKTLADNPDVFIKIIGHTDSDGNAISNQLLSKKRAEAIKAYLSNNFPIAGKRMKVIGKGESEPIASNTTSQRKAKNRRVEFIKINQ